MIAEGEPAPSFELPAVRNGEIQQVALDEFLGDDVIILAFYPADFNPACSGETTDLDDLDLFTMQKDVTILGISGDSIYSHRAFADEYNLHIPLLSDADGEVAADYGVDLDETNAGYHNRRAIVVIDHTETVEYSWVADDLETLFDVDEIRDRVQNVGSEETAEARYTVGHAHYIEGRRAFTSAMQAFEDREWMMAQGDFDRATDEFDEAKEEFNTAVRFSEDDEATTYFSRAENKAEALWRASEWLRDSANAFASGEGAKGDSMRDDAEAPLEEARDIHEPPDPDDFPPEEDPAEQEDETEPDEKAYLEEDDEDVDTSIDLDESEDVTEPAEPEAPTANDSQPDESVPEPAEAGTDAGASADATDEPTEEEAEIDDSELEEIAAELEEQTEAATAGEPTDASEEGIVPDEIESSDTGNGEDSDDRDTDVEEDLELDLTDPTDGEEAELDEEDEEDGEDVPDEDLSDSGDHGVPDSL